MPMCNNWCKWNGTWDLYLLKANLAPPARYKHLKRAEVVMTRLRIGHCKASEGHIDSRGPSAVCHHCDNTLSREHILLECGSPRTPMTSYEANSLTSLFESVHPLAIIEYLKEPEFFHLIWRIYDNEIRNVNSSAPGRFKFRLVIFKPILLNGGWEVSLMKLPSDECHKTLLMISQHWFR